jgi:hypothetical protein
MFLCDVANFSIKDRYNKYLDKQWEKDLRDADIENRSPGRTLRRGALQGAAYGALSPIVLAGMYKASLNKLPKNSGKTILAKAVAGGVTGAGLGMLVRAPFDLKGKAGRNKKEKRLLKNVSRATLGGAALGGLSALTMRGRGYGLQDLVGKTANRIAAGAAIGSTGAYLGTKAYNKLKKDEKN